MSSTAEIAVYTSADCLYARNTGNHVSACNEHLLSGMELLATICSSQNIRWDDTKKRHYLGSLDGSEVLAEHLVRCLQASINSRCNIKEVTLQNDTLASALYDLNTDVPSSPTLCSISSPIFRHADLVSTPNRCSTFALYSPLTFVESANSSTQRKTYALTVKPMSALCDRGSANSLPSTPKSQCHDNTSFLFLKATKYSVLAKDVNLSPLSSLMSSPLSSVVGAESSSSFHSGLSATLPRSPVIASHTRWICTNVSRERNPSDAAAFQTHQEKRRRTLPSPFTSPGRSYNTQCGSNPLANRRLKIGKRSMLSKSQRPRKHVISKAKDDSSIPKGLSKNDVDNLAMTSFLAETLALTRASTMVPSELLQAVLKSQPQLKEEYSEDGWLNIVKQILNDVEMFGKIRKGGNDAKDPILEDEWFYIPEQDKDQNRANLLKGLMLPKRTVTKQPKQYYFKPVKKITRWDPGSD